MRKKLKLDTLTITSFETTSAVAGTVNPTIDTQQMDCWSPLCVPTAGRTCEC